MPSDGHDAPSRLPYHARTSDLFGDAASTAKFSFVVGLATGVGSALNANKRSVALLDVFTLPGVNAHIFKTGATFAAAGVAFVAANHTAKIFRGVDDSVNTMFGAGLIGALAGATHRRVGKVVLFGTVFAVLGGLADYGVRVRLQDKPNPLQLGRLQHQHKAHGAEGHGESH